MFCQPFTNHQRVLRFGLEFPFSIQGQGIWELVCLSCQALLLAFLFKNRKPFVDSSKTTDLGTLHGLDVQIGLDYAPICAWFHDDKRGANWWQFQVEAGVILDDLRGGD